MKGLLNGLFSFTQIFEKKGFILLLERKKKNIDEISVFHLHT